MSAGKGSNLRKGANLRAYWDNYDRIFRNKNNSIDKERGKEKCAVCKGEGELRDVAGSFSCPWCGGTGVLNNS